MQTIHSFTVNGYEPVEVTVECSVENEGFGIHLVGLADAAVKESLLRTTTALQSLGYSLPGKKVIINVAPVCKDGTHYDLPIALTILGASGQAELPNADEFIVAAELGIDASIREIPAWTQAALLAKQTGRKCILPKGAARKAAIHFQDSVDIYTADNLCEAVLILQENENAKRPTAWETFLEENDDERKNATSPEEDWKLVSDEGTKRAIEIAAAGGHPMLLVGSEQKSRTEAALALHAILPPMDAKTALDMNLIHSVCNREVKYGERPIVLSPYTASLTALAGGGCGGAILPGAFSLAHGGVFFVDRIAEMPKASQELLRVALEDKEMKFTRLKNVVTFPADFHPVLGTAPCPCGNYGEGDACVCTPTQRGIYLSKIIGPVYDRLTMQVWVHSNVKKSDIEPKESADDVMRRVIKAREAQMNRQGALNDAIPVKQLDTVAKLDAPCKEIIEKLVTHLGLSLRAYTRILRIARTIADLEGSEDIRTQHLSEAATFRFLDRRTY